MNKIKKIHIVVIIGCLIIATALVIINQQKNTYYTDVVNEILEKEVQGIAFSLEDVVSLQGNSTIIIDVDTETINGKLVDLEDQEYLLGTGIQLFKQLNYMEEIKMESNFKDTGYYLLSLNVDFTEGTNYDEPHKLSLLIDKESHNILLPKDYDIEYPNNISFTNYRCYSPNEASEEYINYIVNEVNAFVLSAKEATYTLDQNYGATMVNLEYASEERVIFRAEFGLFVYDLINEELVRSVDLDQINCGAIQGSNAAEILVNKEGTLVQIHRMDLDVGYLYDIDKNVYTSSIFTPMDDAFKLQDSYDEGLMDNGLVSAYCVKFGDDDYGYLETTDYTVQTLEYVRGDKRYLLFGDKSGREIQIINSTDYAPLEELSKDYSLQMAKEDGCVVYENSDIKSGQLVWDEFVDASNKGNPSMVRLAFYYTLRDPSSYSKEHYDEIKDDYPILYPIDLIFNGDKYSIRFYDEENLIVREYDYMMKYEGQPNKEAIYSDYTYYVLVNDNTVTWEAISKGMYSSQIDDWIDHYRVYTDLIYK